MVFRRIGKSGNSLYVSMPQSFLAYLGLGQGDYMTVTLAKGKIIVAPVKESEKSMQPKEGVKNG